MKVVSEVSQKVVVSVKKDPSKHQDERLSAPESLTSSMVVASAQNEKFVEEMYQRAVDKHQELNTTGKELQML